jgi:hypothetical protein
MLKNWLEDVFSIALQSAATLVPIQIEHFGLKIQNVRLNKNPLPLCSSKGCFPLFRKADSL